MGHAESLQKEGFSQLIKSALNQIKSEFFKKSYAVQLMSYSVVVSSRKPTCVNKM